MSFQGSRGLRCCLQFLILLFLFHLLTLHTHYFCFQVDNNMGVIIFVDPFISFRCSFCTYHFCFTCRSSGGVLKLSDICEPRHVILQIDTNRVVIVRCIVVRKTRRIVARRSRLLLGGFNYSTTPYLPPHPPGTSYSQWIIFTTPIRLYLPFGRATDGGCFPRRAGIAMRKEESIPRLFRFQYLDVYQHGRFLPQETYILLILKWMQGWNETSTSLKGWNIDCF